MICKDIRNINIKPGIKLVEETEGIGEKAKMGDIVRIRLNGWLSKGKQIQNNYVENIVLGNRNIIPGIEKSIEGMKKSGIRKVKISPHLGYGTKGIKDLIPPNAVLIYEIELLDIILGP